MKFKTLLVLLCCLPAAACAADTHSPAQPEQAERTPAPPAAGQNNLTSPDTVENVVVPGNAHVTITRKQDLTIEEYRVGGRLYMIKITPKHGKPYYLVDDRGDGRFARQNPTDFGIRPPMWVIKKF